MTYLTGKPLVYQRDLNRAAHILARVHMVPVPDGLVVQADPVLEIARFTYPQPPDFTGPAFIRQIFYAVTGGHEQYLAGWDADLFSRNAPKLWD